MTSEQQRHCPGCNQRLHFSRFRYRDIGTHGTMCPKFNRLCKACEQKERNEIKNIDRPLTIIERRAEQAARRLHVPKQFVWNELLYKNLVPIYRAMLSPEGRCLSCDHRFDNERDVQIDHIEPPRGPDDWARESARNLMFRCQSCNKSKSNKSYSEWLDQMEDARISNERHAAMPAQTPPPQPLKRQLELFGEG